MIATLKGLAKYLSLDEAVIYFILARVFALVVTPLILLLIASKLTAEEQGFYFAFYSLISLSLFFELGLGGVLTYFASYEYSKLTWTKDNRLSGHRLSMGRLADLLHRSLRWYGAICACFAVIVLCVGYLIFRQYESKQAVDYVLPWILTVLFFSLGTAIIPLTSILDGCGQIAKTQRLRLQQAIASQLSVATVLLLNGKLYAIPVESAASVVVFLIWVLRRYRALLWQLLLHPAPLSDRVSWRNDILPMQMRVAAYVVSAYFQSYAIVPLLFQFSGPVEAGRMGLSMRINNSIYNLSMGWLNVRAPQVGVLVAQGNEAEAYKVVKGATTRGVLVACLGVVALVVLVSVVKFVSPTFQGRVLPLVPMFVLALVVPVSIFLAGLSTFLRAHKIEPYGFPSIITSLVIFLACFLCAYLATAAVLAYVYSALVFFVVLPVFGMIFKQHKSRIFLEAVVCPKD